MDRIRPMRIGFIFFIVFLIIMMPYSLDNKTTKMRSLAVNVLAPTNSCPQKTTVSTPVQCQFSQSYLIPASSDYLQIYSLLGLILFIYLFRLREAVPALIYKPPRHTPVNVKSLFKLI